MQYLIAFGLISCGTFLGFFLHNLLMLGSAEDLAKIYVNQIFKDLKKGRIKIDDLQYLELKKENYVE